MIADPPAPPAPVSAPGRISIREYFSTQAEHFTKDDARKIGPELERLVTEGKTKLRDVVDAARPDNSPLHAYFEWNDRVAAEGFRQMQAGRMVKAIHVYTAGGGQESERPAFTPITVTTVPAMSAASQQGATAPTVAVRGAAGLGMALTPIGRAQGVSRAAGPHQPKAGRRVTITSARDPRTERVAAADDEQLIGAALTRLADFERTFASERDRPAFESIFAPVFSAIIEARERAGVDTLSA